MNYFIDKNNYLYFVNSRNELNLINNQYKWIYVDNNNYALNQYGDLYFINGLSIIKIETKEEISSSQEEISSSSSEKHNWLFISNHYIVDANKQHLYLLNGNNEPVLKDEKNQYYIISGNHALVNRKYISYNVYYYELIYDISSITIEKNENNNWIDLKGNYVFNSNNKLYYINENNQLIKIEHEFVWKSLLSDNSAIDENNKLYYLNKENIIFKGNYIIPEILIVDNDNNNSNEDNNNNNDNNEENDSGTGEKGWFFCNGFLDENYFHDMINGKMKINDHGNNMIQYKNGLFYKNNETSDKFFEMYEHSAVYFEEELKIKGFISKIENRNWGIRSEQLTQYVLYHYDDYNEYFSNIFGENNDYPLTDTYIQQYILMNDLELDLEKFVTKNPLLFNNRGEFMKMIEKMVSNVIEPIFDNTRYLYVYIYREIDRKGICAWREKL